VNTTDLTRGTVRVRFTAELGWGGRMGNSGDDDADAVETDFAIGAVGVDRAAGDVCGGRGRRRRCIRYLSSAKRREEDEGRQNEREKHCYNVP
jgi:hypothetical protein